MARKRPRLSHEGNRSRNDESEHPEPPLLLVFGVYAYEAKRFDEISFQVGDRMKVLQNVEDYYEVLHFKTMRQGLVPKMLVEEERRFEDEEWFFKDIAREKATSLLLSDTGTTGTFLIRKSKQPSFLLYVLHIKYREHEDYKVAHFEIKVSKSGRYYIEFNNSFPSMPALVWNYKNNLLDTLGIKLTNPCTKQDDSNSHGDEIIIPVADIEFKSNLSRGSYNPVSQALWKKKKIDVTVHKISIYRVNSLDIIKSEAMIMKTLDHHRLSCFFGISTTPEEIWTITSYVKGGCLLNYLKGLDHFDKSLMYRISKEIAEGMLYLQKRNFIHKELISRNILLNFQSGIKIYNYWNSRIRKSEPYSRADDNWKYSAPEVLKDNNYSLKSDVWSFGIILFEIFSKGKEIYEGKSRADIFSWLNSGNRLLKPQNADDEIYGRMSKCWQWSTEDRPNFEDLYNFFCDRSSV